MQYRLEYASDMSQIAESSLKNSLVPDYMENSILQLRKRQRG